MCNPNLKTLLRTSSLKLPLESVHQILTDELSKPSAEMDTELVDLCVEAIEKAENEERSKKLVSLFKKDSERLPAEDVRQILTDELSKAAAEMDTKLIDLCVEAIEKADVGEQSKKLVSLFKKDSERLPAEDVHQILTDELSKAAAEMDTNLVDLCVEAIEKAEDGEQSKKLVSLFKKDSERLPAEDVRQILTDELSKTAAEMDTKLIDLCVEAIEKADVGEQSKKLVSLFKKDSERLPTEDVRQILTDELSKTAAEMDTELVDLCVEAIEKSEDEERIKKLVSLFKKDSERLPAEDVRQILTDELSKTAAEMDTELVDLCVEAIEKSEDGEQSRKLVLLFKKDSEKLPAQSVYQIFADELSKSPEEMDTELIDLCAEVLGVEEKAPDIPPEPSGRGGKKITTKRLVIIVAIASALLAVLIPSFASRNRIKAADEVVSVGDNGLFLIDLGEIDGKTSAELYSNDDEPIVETIQKYGIENPVLPEYLLTGKLKFSIEKPVDEDEYFVLFIKFKDSENKREGSVKIKNNTALDYTPGEIDVNDYFGNVRHESVNGLDALTFFDEEKSITYYVNDNAEYTVLIHKTV